MIARWSSQQSYEASIIVPRRPWIKQYDFNSQPSWHAFVKWSISRTRQREGSRLNNLASTMHSTAAKSPQLRFLRACAVAYYGDNATPKQVVAVPRENRPSAVMARANFVAESKRRLRWAARESEGTTSKPAPGSSIYRQTCLEDGYLTGNVEVAPQSLQVPCRPLQVLPTIAMLLESDALL